MAGGRTKASKLFDTFFSLVIALTPLVRVIAGVGRRAVVRVDSGNEFNTILRHEHVGDEKTHFGLPEFRNECRRQSGGD